MSTTEQDLPCLQKPRSYQGQSLILDSGSICRNGHSLLLHSPARVNTQINTGTNWHKQNTEYTLRADRQSQIKYSRQACVILWNIKSTNQTWSRSSIQASWSCRIHGETRTGLPSYTVLWASAYTPPSSLHWCDGTDTSPLGVETKHKMQQTFLIHTHWAGSVLIIANIYMYVYK